MIRLQSEDISGVQCNRSTIPLTGGCEDAVRSHKFFNDSMKRVNEDEQNDTVDGRIEQGHHFRNYRS